MQILKRFILFSLIVVLALSRMSAQTTDSVETKIPQLDSVEVSLLTCTPGEDVYAKFGHTALRVIDYTTEEDIVFNYGCFNYNSDNFLFKFLLGQTDYLLGAERADYFMARYQGMGNGVVEQKLNLTQEEANKLLSLLFLNLQPENQEYRYKWIGNNCTDKARLIIEESISGKVMYDFSGAKNDSTVREILHNCLKNNPWTCLGVDFLLGGEIDKIIDLEQEDSQDNLRKEHLLKMFIPAIFMAEADKTIIELADGTTIPYVKEKRTLFEPTYVESKPSMLSPIVVFGALLVIVIAISVFDIKRKKQSLWLDVLLCIAQGGVGLLIAFLFFFSEHPGVDSNWLVGIFNPLPLFYAGWLVYCDKKNKPNKIAIFIAIYLVLFLICMIICSQVFNVAFYLMVITMLVRAIVQTIIKK